jgi:disulfide bond formation protein DsbB
MEGYAATLTYIFALGTVVLDLVLLAALIHRIVAGTWLPEKLERYVAPYAIVVAAMFAVAGFLLTLFYSEIVGLEACVLCWFARTMMYPLAVLLPIAAYRKDMHVWVYALPLATIGALITGYQHLLQIGFIEGNLCNVLSSTGASCAVRYVYEFGYVTMPMFGLTLFAVVGLLVWMARRG